MTCVAALARDGQAWIAYDDETNYGGTRLHGAQKVRLLRLGAEVALLAADGSGAILSTALREVDPPPLPGKSEPLQAWADEYASLVSRALASATPPIVDSDNANLIDGALLLALRGQLWYLFTHQATRIPEVSGCAVAALGSGTDVALGAMRAFVGWSSTEPSDIVNRAVGLAIEYSPGVSGGPFLHTLGSA